MKKLTFISGAALFVFSLTFSSCVEDTKTDEEKIQEHVNKAEEAESIHEYSSAKEYNAVIVGLQMKFKIVAVEIEEYSGTDITYIRELNQKLKNECTDALSIAEKLSFTRGDDDGLKESLIEEIKHHECCYMTERELQLLGKIYSKDASIEEIEEYYSIVEASVVQFKRMNDNVYTSQDMFLKANNLVAEEDNVLDKRIDELREDE